MARITRAARSVARPRPHAVSGTWACIFPVGVSPAIVHLSITAILGQYRSDTSSTSDQWTPDAGEQRSPRHLPFPSPALSRLEQFKSSLVNAPTPKPSEVAVNTHQLVLDVYAGQIQEFLRGGGGTGSPKRQVRSNWQANKTSGGGLLNPLNLPGSVTAMDFPQASHCINTLSVNSERLLSTNWFCFWYKETFRSGHITCSALIPVNTCYSAGPWLFLYYI